jgi:glycosyltransferase involved in cell wall biosynthesis
VQWHVLSSTYFDFDQFERDSREDRSPNHVLPLIAERLGATVHQPSPDSGVTRRRDRLGAAIYGQPMHWELARRTIGQLRDGDAVYAAGCDTGVPLALLCALRRRRVSFAISFIDVTRRRSRIVGWLLVLLRIRLLLVLPTDLQAEEARAGFGRRAVDIDTIDGQTDTAFFRPPDRRISTLPPLVAGSGVEQRDYATMGDALGDADVQVQVCFASPNKTDKTRFSMPDPIPANTTFRWMDFGDLRTLYQQADVMVLALRPNRYSAGLTSLFEAIACGAPIVVTESPGIIDRLIAEELVTGIPAEDPAALRKAVEDILGDAVWARARAARAREVLLERYSADAFLDRLDGLLRRFAEAG